MTMPCDDAGTSVVQRFEVFTGVGRRREWPAESKAAIIAESYSGKETVCSVARRHGLSPGQLFSWRRQLRNQLDARGVALPKAVLPPPSFVPAVIDPLPASDPVPRPKRQRRRGETGVIELEIDGVPVRIGRGVDAGMIGAVIKSA